MYRSESMVPRSCFACSSAAVNLNLASPKLPLEPHHKVSELYHHLAPDAQAGLTSSSWPGRHFECTSASILDIIRLSALCHSLSSSHSPTEDKPSAQSIIPRIAPSREIRYLRHAQVPTSHTCLCPSALSHKRVTTAGYAPMMHFCIILILCTTISRSLKAPPSLPTAIVFRL